MANDKSTVVGTTIVEKATMIYLERGRFCYERIDRDDLLRDAPDGGE